MARTQPPEVQVGDPVAFALDRDLDFSGHTGIWRAVKQDRAGVAYQRDRPARNHQSADETGERVHPEPAERACQQQAGDDQHRYGGIGHHMNDRGAHIVVAMMHVIGMIMIMIMVVVVVMTVSVAVVVMMP